jgi:hypothetical protein
LIHLASILGYGDSLISLSLLERAAGAGVRVLGSGVTQSVSGLLRNPVALDKLLFDDVAAFYVLKERGPLAAARDLLRFRRWARRTLTGADTLILENNDRRNRWIVPAGGCTVIEVPRSTTAYQDREAALWPFLGAQPWPLAAVQGAVARRLLINPSARAHTRVLPMHIVAKALRAAAEVGAEVCLIDVDGGFAKLRAQVKTYLRAPPLAAAAAALREADRYFGPDSFFMHLAYYHRVPQLALFHPENIYFMPPGMKEQGQYLYFSEAADSKRLGEKLRQLLERTQSE